MSELKEDLLNRSSCSHHILSRYRKAKLQPRSGPGHYHTVVSVSTNVYVTTFGLVFVRRSELCLAQYHIKLCILNIKALMEQMKGGAAAVQR